MTGDTGYVHAIDRIWENVVTKKLYITGGIGATNNGEAFGKNYELPNLSAYCETCAAIGNVYWNYRLFLLHGESKYYDVLERTLYNGLISGVSLEGNGFFTRTLWHRPVSISVNLGSVALVVRLIFAALFLRCRGIYMQFMTKMYMSISL